MTIRPPLTLFALPGLTAYRQGVIGDLSRERSAVILLFTCGHTARRRNARFGPYAAKGFSQPHLSSVKTMYWFRLRLSSLASFSSRAFRLRGSLRLYGTGFSFFTLLIPKIMNTQLHQVNTNAIPKILDADRQPNWYHSPSMTDDEKPRSIRFPQALWDAIDRDAMRCKRSAVKQMEAVLSEYYRIANVELSRDALSKMDAPYLTETEHRETLVANEPAIPHSPRKKRSGKG